MRSFSLGEIANQLSLKLIGDSRCEITGLGTLSGAQAGQLSFLSNPSYIRQLVATQASAVIVDQRFADASPGNVLISDQPYVSFAYASELFSSRPIVKPGVHETAYVSPLAKISSSAHVGANAVIEDGVEIGDNVFVGPGTVIGRGVVLGSDCVLHANVTLYHSVYLGCRVCVHSNAVIGADGFGFAFDGGKNIKIQQLGRVRIGNDVDIGAGTTIDRGTIEDTVIDQGVKIDNQVQIGHNTQVGAHTVICGCTAIAGSAKIGKFCVLGGGSGMLGHLTLADGVQVSAMSLVSRSITEPGAYSSGTGQMKLSDWKRAIVRFQQLDRMARRLKELERLTDKN